MTALHHTPAARQAPRQIVAHALRNLAPTVPASRIWGRLEGATPEQAADGNAWAADPDDIANLVLTVVTDLMRDEIGQPDCGCGGCDSCAQHALIDWLDPR